jgi:N-acetylneuraminate synthase
MDLPKIIVEAGLNHNGHVDLAIEIADMCLEAADNTGYPRELLYIKFQKRSPEASTPEHMRDVQRVSPHDGKIKSYIEYKHDVEFGLSEYGELDWITDACGGIFASAWDTESVYFIINNFPHWPYIKIPSAHLTNRELLITAAETKMPMIISTGMSTKDEIETAHGTILPINNNLKILSCTATYPCIDKEINFYKLGFLSGRFGASNVGFSAHSPSPYPAIYSNFYDVDMIEVHVTTDRSLPGSDQSASLEQPGLELLMRETMRIPKLLGDGRFIYDSELAKRKSLRGY